MSYSRSVVALAVALLALATPALANDYYLSATGGSLSNPGTQASPWPNLQTVAASGKTFASGDNLILREHDKDERDAMRHAVFPPGPRPRTAGTGWHHTARRCRGDGRSLSCLFWIV